VQFISEVGVLFNDFGDIEQVIPGQANEKEKKKRSGGGVGATYCMIVFHTVEAAAAAVDGEVKAPVTGAGQAHRPEDDQELEVSLLLEASVRTPRGHIVGGAGAGTVGGGAGGGGGGGGGGGEPSGNPGRVGESASFSSRQRFVSVVAPSAPAVSTKRRSLADDDGADADADGAGDGEEEEDDADEAEVQHGLEALEDDDDGSEEVRQHLMSSTVFTKRTAII
jgi:hypothetical protein